MTQTARPGTTLPPWRSVLAVVAHPDDESFGLGAVLSAFVDAGAAVTVLCFTQGEASTLHGVPGDLSRVRAVELESAAGLLGVREALMRAHPDGELESVGDELLAADVASVAGQVGADGLLVFDRSGVTGHPDHRAATRAALRAAERLGLSVLAWTLPGDVADTLALEYAAPFVGTRDDEVDLVVTVDRERQRAAALAHASQALPTSVLWRRLELLGDREHLVVARPH